MTQPAFYLFSPSREDANRLGMGEWYDCGRVTQFEPELSLAWTY